MSVGLLFLDAMSKILAFPKFLKTLCSNGRNLDEIVQVSKEANLYAFMIGNLPPKLADLGRLSIPVTVGLGANVSLMKLEQFPENLLRI